jgi:hypothetical protein
MIIDDLDSILRTRDDQSNQAFVSLCVFEELVVSYAYPSGFPVVIVGDVD